MNWTPELLEKYRQMARDKWRTATPFRLGFVVGFDGFSAPAPYTKAHALRLYRNGLLFGANERAAIADRSHSSEGIEGDGNAEGKS